MQTSNMILTGETPILVGGVEFTPSKILGFLKESPKGLETFLEQQLDLYADYCKAIPHVQGVIDKGNLMFGLEMAAILYFKRLDENHSLKTKHTPSQVEEYLITFRDTIYGKGKCPYTDN